jgi:DNA topoisomerase-1
MEELGIGSLRPTRRPYIPYERYYVKKSGRSLIPTELGRIVNKHLVENFPNLISVKSLRQGRRARRRRGRQEGNEEGRPRLLRPLLHRLKDAYDRIDSIKGIFDEPTENKCDKCGAPMVKKLGKNGFLSPAPAGRTVRPPSLCRSANAPSARTAWLST